MMPAAVTDVLTVRRHCLDGLVYCCASTWQQVFARCSSDQRRDLAVCNATGPSGLKGTAREPVCTYSSIGHMPRLIVMLLGKLHAQYGTNGRFIIYKIHLIVTRYFCTEQQMQVGNDVQVTVQSALLTSPGQSLASGQGNW